MSRRQAGPLVRTSIAATALAVLLLGSCADDSGDSPDASPSSAAPSGTFTIDGHELVLDCVGEGDTTMVLEVGEAAPSQALAPIGDAYASTMRVCSYDRAGTGRDIASDLHGVLEAAGVPGPYLLVGHSAGGLLVLAYAAAYPEELAGVVAINPVPPWHEWSTLGLRGMTPQERRGEAAYYAGANGESLDYRDVSRLIDESPVPQDVPLHLLISTAAQCESPQDVCTRLYPVYERIMKGVARRWGEGRFSEVQAPHDIHVADPAAVERAVDDVLSRARQQ
jgi:pimeloyl-ACP methyl ester carboxylesterase